MAKTSPKKCGRVLSIFIAIIATHLLCQILANSRGFEFLIAIFKFKKKRENFVVVCLLPP